MKKYRDLLNELPSKSVVFTFGRFNPPNVGHELLIKVVRKLAKQRKSDQIVFVCTSQDKKNPLDISKKIQYLELFFPNTKFVQVDSDAAWLNYISRYKNAVMVSPSDMVAGYNKLLKKQKFESVEVVSTGSRNPDDCDKEVKNSSRGNYTALKSGLPTTVRDLDGKRLMNDVRIGLGLEPIKEQINLVKDDLREQYFRGEIFKEGDIVESSSKVYRIIKRGSNHLLLQNEEGAKVSKWIQDVQLTEREFMLDNKLIQEADSSATGGAQAAAKKAEKQTASAELAAKQAKETEQLKLRQAREAEAVKTQMKEASDSPVVNTKSKYNIAKSLMSLNDFRKTMGMGQKPINVDNDKETESDIDAEVASVTPQHTHVGSHQMNTDGNQSLRRMKVNYHLGEETEEQKKTREDQLKRFKDQASDAKLDCSCKEEFGIEEEELIALVEADLDALTEEDFYEAYDDNELAIIDDETGEEIEAVSEEAELDTPVLMEILSRHERIKARARMRRTAAKRQRREKVALRTLSTPQVANKRARRMAISAMKKRLMRGQNPQKASVGQKERVERFIAQRRKIVDRLATRMVSRVKQVEKARMSHKKFTKPNNGVQF